ncbi:uncharacterized protein LOC123720215 [Pieris brassicae]|nr:uncharacterized protein LOC123720215 [Pieris brassicae]
MSEEREVPIHVSLKVPVIKNESATQTPTVIIAKSSKKQEICKMDDLSKPMSLRKRRNISKNRAQNTRQREKTPEPGRTLGPHEDTPTSDDEDPRPQRTSREIEADNTYEEMKRLVQEKANEKDPVYDIDTDEIMETRAMEANARRRRSISPFAVPEKEEGTALERKGSFIDPTNKLLSTNYIVSPKDDDLRRRNSLTGAGDDVQMNSRSSLSPPGTASASPKEKDFPYPLPATPKKLEEVVYPDEKSDKKVISRPKPPRAELKQEEIFKEKEAQSIKKTSQVIIPDTPIPTTGELVTRVIQVERTPSKKLNQDQKPIVEVRERVVRTPSRKLTAEATVTQKSKPHESQTKVPPVKPARSKSASRLANRTSESEMSEDQMYQQNVYPSETRRKVVPTPRRFLKNKLPKENRSQSVNRIEDIKVIDKTGTGMSQTSLEIIELMQKARARSLSIPKDDERLPADYKTYSRTLQTPNKTPVNLRRSRGISCPKTIQIISNREILSGLTKVDTEKVEVRRKHSRQSSGYVDASQSEYTSSCYSTSPSENEYEFDLLDRTAELTRKLNQLSQIDTKEKINQVKADVDQNDNERKSVLRKRSIISTQKEINFDANVDKTKEQLKAKEKIPSTKPKLTRFKIINNWRQFKLEYNDDWQKMILLRNKCICDLLILIILCGLGGMMFKALEGSFENAFKCNTRNVKRDFIEHLWRGSHYLREEDWKSMARKKLYEFEDQLHTAHEAGVTSYSGQRSWNFMNSFVYCLTLITTIGYGHIAPKTTYGRVATIVYAIIGIPLFLIVLADFGKLFTRIIKFFWAFIRRFYYTRSCRRVRRTAPMQEVMKGLNIVYDVVRRPSQIFSEDDIDTSPNAPPPIERKSSDVPPPLPPKPGQKLVEDAELDTPAPSVFEIDDEFNLPISVAITILVIYIIIGAVGYSIWETWNFFESFYFVFVSMSTIGLGDLVPDHPMFMMASILYLVFGLALTSMCINVVQVKLSDTFKQASAKLGATIGLKVAEEDGSLVPITPPPVEIAPVHKSTKDIDEIKSTDDAKNR